MIEDTMEMMAKLNEITEAVDGIKLSVQRSSGDDQVVRENLTHIWGVTQDLERRLARPEIIAGYRQDAVAQLDRVHQLIGEAPGKDERQLLSIGLACELAMDKIRKYLKMSRNAANRAALAATAVEA